MKVAVMQPYVFPYIGYFELILAVDRFVIFDDVNYIPRGWINRNQVLVGGRACMLTVPVAGASQNRLICDTLIAQQPWQNKWLRTLEINYRKAPEFAQVMPLLEKILTSPHSSIADLARASFVEISTFLGIKTEFISSSSVYGNREIKGQNRILDICKREGAKMYVNPPGGRHLYDRKKFAEQGIELRFLQPSARSYPQFGGAFLPWLSIIDVLMFNGPGQCAEILEDYCLVP